MVLHTVLYFTQAIAALGVFRLRYLLYGASKSGFEAFRLLEYRLLYEPSFGNKHRQLAGKKQGQ